MTEDGKKDYPLSKLLEKQKEIVEQLKINYSRLKLISEGKNFRKIDKKDLIVQQKDLREKLVQLKVLINKSNQKIYSDIFRLSELKVFLTELRMANLPKLQGEIKYTEAQIESIEKSLKKHNESVKIPWFNLISIKMHGPIV